MDQELANLEDDADKTHLHAVHLCITCGHETRRSEMDAQALISGVVVCPACGDSGPLNVVIRSSEDEKPPKKSTG